MLRRLPTALLLAAGLSSFAALASDPARPSHGSITLGGGFSLRDTTLPATAPERPVSEDPQAQATKLVGFSPGLVRLRGDWFPLSWLGIEGEGVGDFFLAKRVGVTSLPSKGGMGRLGASARYHAPSGFVLNGALGYGFSFTPVIRIRALGDKPSADSIFSNGPMARVGIGYSGSRFEGIAGATLILGLQQKVSQLEPRLWLATRLAELGPAALWVGLDAGYLVDASPTGYAGRNLRLALALKLELLPPAPATKPLVGPTPSATTLQVQVRLPDGTPAAGALVSLDQAAPVAVDPQGLLLATTTPGAHTAEAKLAGHRPASATGTAVAGAQTPLVLTLVALTGPGQLSGVVRAAATGNPVADATVTVGEAPPAQTGADGTYKLEGVGPGPVKVRVDAQGFTSADELAQVPPESAATLDVQLEALGKGSPATVRGLIRSRTGEAVKASVVIKGLATRVDVTPEGRFFVTVPGGTYQFIISAPGYLTQVKKVVLADGDQAIVHTELQKATK